MDPLIVGAKNIASFFQLKKLQTLRDWEEKYKLPIRRDPAGRVYMIMSEAIQWLIIYDQVRRQEKTKQTPRGAVKIMMEHRMKAMEELSKV